MANWEDSSRESQYRHLAADGHSEEEIERLMVSGDDLLDWFDAQTEEQQKVIMLQPQELFSDKVRAAYPLE